MLWLLVGCGTSIPTVDSEPLRLWYADADHDGAGDPDTTQLAADRPGGWVMDGDDCDDTDPDVRPWATETCDGRDEDCDGEIDDDVAEPDGFLDADGDGYGTEPACGGAAVDGDCDDTSADVHPGAEDPCGDVIDQDCDGEVARCEPWGSRSIEDGHVIWGPSDSGAGLLLEAADLDGDGRDELLTVGEDEEGDTIWAIPDPYTRDTTDQEPLASWSSGTGTDYGAVVTTDLDGDGAQDVVIAAYTSHPGEVLPTSRAVLLSFGPVAGDQGLGAITLTSDDPDDSVGTVLAAVPDSDGDGVPELLVGVRRPRAENSVVGLLPAVPRDGPALWSDLATTTFSGYGSEYSCDAYALPDLDGDGLAEVAAADMNASSDDGNDAGIVSIFYGPVAEGTLDLRSGDLLLPGDSSGDRVAAARSPGDTDGDGRADLVVLVRDWSEGGTDAGGVFLFLAPGTGERSPTEADTRLLGSSPDGDIDGLGPAADLDGDGLADVLIGGSGAYDADGAVWAFRGPFAAGVLDVADADLAVIGDATHHRLGEPTSMVTFHDDGDAATELALGCPACQQEPKDEHGAIALFRGAAW